MRIQFGDMFSMLNTIPKWLSPRGVFIYGLSMRCTSVWWKDICLLNVWILNGLD